MNSAKFKHDCDKCKFMDHKDNCDFYFCDSTIPTVIARFSDEPQDYSSGLFLAKSLYENAYVNEPLYKAYEIALKLNLVK